VICFISFRRCEKVEEKEQLSTSTSISLITAETKLIPNNGLVDFSSYSSENDLVAAEGRHKGHHKGYGHYGKQGHYGKKGRHGSHKQGESSSLVNQQLVIGSGHSLAEPGSQAV